MFSITHLWAHDTIKQQYSTVKPSSGSCVYPLYRFKCVTLTPWVGISFPGGKWHSQGSIKVRVCFQPGYPFAMQMQLWKCTRVNNSQHYKYCVQCHLISVQYIFFKFYLFILFMAVLGLRLCARALSSCGEWGPLFIAVRGPLTVAAHRLQTRRLSSCGSRAQLLCGMWDLPRPGLEPASPALAGGFSTAAPPGKPKCTIFNRW